jgi:penicillin-binding protein 2
MGFSTGRKPWKSEPYQEVPDELKLARSKLFYFSVLIVFLFAILSVQLARIQLVNGDKYKARAETNRLREVPLIPQRGLIFDRNGQPLVENRPSFAAAVVAADLPKSKETEITIQLQEITGVPAGEIAAKIEQRRDSNDPFSPIVFKDNLPQDVAFSLQEKLSSLPGVRVVVTPRREYTTGPLLAHILGFVRSVDADEYDVLKAQGYQLSDHIGKAGVELTYESVLRGTPGVRDVEADASGREIRVIDEQPAKPGSNVILSIDLELQKNVERMLREGMGPSKNASAIVMDVNTGEILAMVSLPGYDNNVFSGIADPEAVRRLNEDPGKPMLNHAVAEQYAPGSTFKMITGLAALQEGVATANTSITSVGYIIVKNEFDSKIEYKFMDWRSDLGTMNFYRGIAMSSDVYMYYVAGGYNQPGKPFFQGMGEEKLAAWTKRFGLGQKTGIDVPGEAEGNVPDPEWKKKTFGEPWTIGDTYNMSIGQGYVAATPIQMITVASAVANGGKVITPHVVKELRDGNGKTTATVPTNVKRDLNIDPRNIAIMREAMRQSVADGAANLGASRNVQVAGKTGTAEFGETIGNNQYLTHGWFTGYAPFDKPQIAINVFVEQGTGGGTAAPIASRILSYYFGRPQRAESR